MSINDIFALINSNVAKVDSIVDSIDVPNMKKINRWYGYAERYQYDIFWENFNNIWDYAGTISYVLYWLMESYERMLVEYGDSIKSTREAVDESFSRYYNEITYMMAEGITKTRNEIYKRINLVSDRIDQIDINIGAQIEAEIDESGSWLTGLIDTLESVLGVDIQSLWDGIAETASEIYGAIEDKAASIYLTVDGWVKDLWDYVVPWFEWIEAEFIAYYKAVRKWIADKAVEIYAVIEAKVKELKDFIDLSVGDVWRQLINVQITLKTMIAALEATLRSWVTKGVNEIQAILIDLSLLTDWRFQFLNIFMSKPELSILQVLTRDEATFQHHKPYWQAFFTRVMEAE